MGERHVVPVEGDFAWRERVRIAVNLLGEFSEWVGLLCCVADAWWSGGENLDGRQLWVPTAGVGYLLLKICGTGRRDGLPTN